MRALNARGLRRIVGQRIVNCLELPRSKSLMVYSGQCELCDASFHEIGWDRRHENASAPPVRGCAKPSFQACSIWRGKPPRARGRKFRRRAAGGRDAADARGSGACGRCAACIPPACRTASSREHAVARFLQCARDGACARTAIFLRCTGCRPMKAAPCTPVLFREISRRESEIDFHHGRARRIAATSP